MAKGGARAVSGPPPNPHSRRQTTGAQAGTWLDLPADGRKGRTPKWPFGYTYVGEVEAWRELWRSPQAVAWEALGVNLRDVAHYVRESVAAEVDPKRAAEARQWSDRLGLNPPAMARNRWRIAPAEAEADGGSTRRARPAPVRRPPLVVVE